MTAVGLDIHMDEPGTCLHDMLTWKGFIAAVAAVRRLHPGALLFGGVPCSSWAWVSVCGWMHAIVGLCACVFACGWLSAGVYVCRM